MHRVMRLIIPILKIVPIPNLVNNPLEILKQKPSHKKLVWSITLLML